jgi:hypothetical protein
MPLPAAVRDEPWTPTPSPSRKCRRRPRALHPRCPGATYHDEAEGAYQLLDIMLERQTAPLLSVAQRRPTAWLHRTKPPRPRRLPALA